MLQHSPSTTGWKIQIFLVGDETRQRRILDVFARIARPGVVVQAARSGPDCFVIVESSSTPSEIHARRVVRSIDPTAQRTYESRERVLPQV